MKIFLQSLKLKKDFLWILSYDLLYYAIFVGLIALYIYSVLPQAAFYGRAVSFMQSLQSNTQTPLEELAEQANELTTQLTIFITLTILFVVVLFCNYAFFKGFIWSRLLGKKFSVGNFFNYLIANVMFILLAALILYFTNSFVFQSISIKLLLVYALLGIYFLNVLHPLLQLENGFTIEKKFNNKFLNAIFSAILFFANPIVDTAVIFGKSLWYCVLYSYRLILPFIIMVVIFFAIIVILNIIKRIIPLQFDILYYLYLAVCALAVIICFNWSKVYMKNLLTKE